MKTMKYKCPCCGNFTFNAPANYTCFICPVCFWEDDGWQLEHPDDADGANHVSLNQAQENYRNFGACEMTMKKHVRAPEPEELPENNAE